MNDGDHCGGHGIGYGGYDGDDGGGFSSYVNYQNYSPWYKPVPPPLTAIDRFLWTQPRIDHQPQNLDTINEPFSCFAPYVPMGKSFVVDENGDMFSNDIGECITWDEIRSYPNHSGNRDESSRVIEPEKNLKSYVKKSKGGGKLPKVLIKGQWTEDEDSKLIRLVKEFGERKWALIAEKMIGRAGKQCRERWRNHLRPNIKKDTWSEEEVRILIQAHQKVGNKWADIAKLIPGRTENSIKNQWNATKRKQISCKKYKKNGTKNKKTQYSLLEEYIRSKTCDHNLASSSSSITTTTTEKSNIIVHDLINSNNNDSDPSLEITQSYDDELNFMQTFFQTTTTTSTSNESSIHGMEPKSPTITHSLGFSSNSRCGFPLFSSPLHDENSNMYLINYPEDEMSKTHMTPSANHLEEAVAMPSSCEHSYRGEGSSSSAKKIWIW